MVAQYISIMFVLAAMTLMPILVASPQPRAKATGEPVANPAIQFECAGYCFSGNRLPQELISQEEEVVIGEGFSFFQ